MAAISLQREGTESSALVDAQRDGLHGAGEGKACLSGDYGTWIRAGCPPQTLERNWKTIRDEALAVMDKKSGLFVPEEENLRERGEWGQYTLWQQGRPPRNI